MNNDPTSNVTNTTDIKSGVVNRAERRRQEKLERKQQKQMEFPPSRNEMYHFLNQLSQAISDTNRKLDVMSLVTSALTDLIVEKGICTRTEVSAKIDHIVEETNKLAQEKKDAEQAAKYAAMSAAASGAITTQPPIEPEHA